MSAAGKIHGLYAILDHGGLRGRDPLRVARSLIRGGAQVLQFRAKGLGDRVLLGVCTRLAGLCRAHGVAFIVNDRADIALASGATGVHLGHEDLPVASVRKMGRLLVGVSSHSVAQAAGLARSKPDYVALGPIARSRTKRTRRNLLGMDGIRRARQKVHCPLVAIGGLDLEGAVRAKEAGADAVAMAGAVLTDDSASMRIANAIKQTRRAT